MRMKNTGNVENAGNVGITRNTVNVENAGNVGHLGNTWNGGNAGNAGNVGHLENTGNVENATNLLLWRWAGYWKSGYDSCSPNHQPREGSG